MDDKYFNIDEAMVDYAEMTSFNFESSSYLALASEKESATGLLNNLKFESFNAFKNIQSMFARPSAVKK